LIISLVNLNSIFLNLQFATIIVYCQDLILTKQTFINTFLGFNIILLFVGFFFKLVFFPFFFWLADIYETVPYFIFILLTVFYKINIFFICVKLFFLITPVFYNPLILDFCVLFGVYSFVFGLIGAFYSEKIRLFIFYTSINQMGLFLISVSQVIKIEVLGFLFTDVYLFISIFYYFINYIVSLLFFLILTQMI
jgi:NADH:ubiquinone oxidoreductase subunit 2 (subunit N)